MIIEIRTFPENTLVKKYTDVESIRESIVPSHVFVSWTTQEGKRVDTLVPVAGYVIDCLEMR